MSDAVLNATRLPASALRRRCDPASLGFRTTDELEPIDGLIGQDRALEAIDVGVRIDKIGFNLFILGARGSARHNTVRSLVEHYATKMPTPLDWVYVYNFAQPKQPRAIALPPGRAPALKAAMDHVVEELLTSLPAVFDSEEYQSRRHALDEDSREHQEQSFEALNDRARKQHIALLRTPSGFAFAPLSDGQVMKPQAFDALPEEERKSIDARIVELQKDLNKILENVPRWERERSAKLRELDESFARIAVEDAIAEARTAFADLPEVSAHLDAVTKDMIRRANLFSPQSRGGDEDGPGGKPDFVAEDDPRFRRYRINLFVTHDKGEGAPLVMEENPSVGNLVGRVEHQARMGALVADFTLIRPGSLHKANGGFLLIDARRLLIEPLAWEALKRALRAQRIAIEAPFDRSGVTTIASLEPEQIPLSVKVFLFGDRFLYYSLMDADPDFADLFKIAADFEDAVPLDADVSNRFARLIASIVKNEKLLPFSAAAVARVIEEQSRDIEDTKRLSVRVGALADRLREADFWAREMGHAVVEAADVDRAVVAQDHRSDRARVLTLESITRDIVKVKTSGAEIGQVNGLSILALGGYSFGKPSRITARVRMGTGRVIDIEREVALGGPLHSKGVLILSSYLSSHYALNAMPSLYASLVFEQSYSGVDGDSASSAELYALLSALAEVPIRQNFAVTGSVDQNGDVQAIGGANRKIEGFFDLCRARGLNGTHGVLIPASNVQHLMLREDVVEAAAKKQFNIYAVSTIDQGIEILTGVEAGKRGADGLFPAGSINRRVEDRLIAFSEARRRYLQSSLGEGRPGEEHS